MNNAPCITEAIVSLYEKFPDMTVEEIAEDRQVNVDYVRAILMTKSSLYRDLNKRKEAKREFISQEELYEFYDNLKALARYTESDIVKEKCLTRLIDDARGRLDKKPPESVNVGNTINIIQVMLDRAKANKEIALVGSSNVKELEEVA